MQKNSLFIEINVQKMEFELQMEQNILEDIYEETLQW